MATRIVAAWYYVGRDRAAPPAPNFSKLRLFALQNSLLTYHQVHGQGTIRYKTETEARQVDSLTQNQEHYRSSVLLRKGWSKGFCSPKIIVFPLS